MGDSRSDNVQLCSGSGDRYHPRLTDPEGHQEILVGLLVPTLLEAGQKDSLLVSDQQPQLRPKN